jgi:hypothetical protein
LPARNRSADIIQAEPQGAMTDPDERNSAFSDPLFKCSQPDSKVSGYDFLRDKGLLDRLLNLALLGGRERHSF